MAAGSKGETTMKTLAKLTLVIATLATGLASSASASTHGEATYYDTIRPHGHPRSDAIYNASVNACYRSSGQSRTAVHDNDAFKSCMLSRGYRFQYTDVVQDPPSAAERAVAQRSYTGPSVTISIGGGGDNEAADTAAENNDWAAQQEQSATDAANAGYAQDAATAAANVAAAATFDAQMTVGN
jgi:hypothetical protein